MPSPNRMRTRVKAHMPMVLLTLLSILLIWLVYSTVVMRVSRQPYGICAHRGDTRA